MVVPWTSRVYIGVSKNRWTPKSSILIGFSIIFTIHFGVPIFLETPISRGILVGYIYFLGYHHGSGKKQQFFGFWKQLFSSSPDPAFYTSMITKEPIFCNIDPVSEANPSDGPRTTSSGLLRHGVPNGAAAAPARPAPPRVTPVAVTRGGTTTTTTVWERQVVPGRYQIHKKLWWKRMEVVGRIFLLG